MALGTGSYSTLKGCTVRPRLSKQEEHRLLTRSSDGNRRHLCISTDVHKTVVASCTEHMWKVRGRSVDGLRPDRLFQRSEVGMRLAVPSALELALGGRAAFVHRPRPSS